VKRQDSRTRKRTNLRTMPTADVPAAVASTSPVELAPGNLNDDDQLCYVPRMFLLRSTENIPNHVAPCRVLFSFVPFICFRTTWS
jgi:hypothetical protein